MQKNHTKNLRSFLWHFIKRYKWAFLIAQICFFAWSLDSILWPYALKLLIDKIVAFDFTGSIWLYLLPVLIFWVGLWVGVEILFRAFGFIIAYTMPKFYADIRMSMFSYVEHHSYTYFANNFAGKIANKISDMLNSTRNIMLFLQTLCIPILFTLLAIEIMFLFIQPLFGLIILVWFILHMSVALIGGKYCGKYSEAQATSRSSLMGKIVDVFTNIVNVKLFAKEHAEYVRLMRAQDDERQKNKVALVFVEKIRVIFGILSIIFPGILVTWVMIYSYSQHLISVGDVVLIFNINWIFTFMTWMLGTQLPMFYYDVGVCKQALRVMQAPHDIVNSKHAKDVAIKHGQIEFKDVDFKYSQNNLVFNKLNIKIIAGSKVGLVGFSGSGKSTFVNLIMRFFDLQDGAICIDDFNIKDIKLACLRRSISMIPQDPSLFHRSVLENIKYANEDLSFEQVVQAAKYANCNAFIESLPEKYDTLVGERGIKLSGGQRQRIAIARAILKDAPILILDEATSALDSVTEKKIQEALEYLMENKTTIVIAHRLSTLSNMDRILVFDNGKIVEDGKFQELLESQGHFYKMWQMQADGFLPDVVED
jgi:ATP-binding cassette subfamily B protein